MYSQQMVNILNILFLFQCWDSDIVYLWQSLWVFKLLYCIIRKLTFPNEGCHPNYEWKVTCNMKVHRKNCDLVTSSRLHIDGMDISIKSGAGQTCPLLLICWFPYEFTELHCTVSSTCSVPSTVLDTGDKEGSVPTVILQGYWLRTLVLTASILSYCG